MALHRLTLLASLLMGCQFDSSVPISADVSVDGGAGGAATGCSSFVPQPCGECGTLRCSETAEGAQIECAGTLERGSCAANQVCSLDGQCETAGAGPECQPGDFRTCGECADELCVGGQWAGQCEARNDLCDDDESCVELAFNNYRCEPSCSTEGHRSPCMYGGGNATPIPDFVPPGTVWSSRDQCDEEQGCQQCICIVDFLGNPRVNCDFRCD